MSHTTTHTTTRAAGPGAARADRYVFDATAMLTVHARHDDHDPGKARAGVLDALQDADAAAPYGIDLRCGEVTIRSLAVWDVSAAHTRTPEGRVVFLAAARIAVYAGRLGETSEQAREQIRAALADVVDVGHWSAVHVARLKLAAISPVPFSIDGEEEPGLPLPPLPPLHSA